MMCETLALPMAKEASREPALGRVLVVLCASVASPLSDARIAGQAGVDVQNRSFLYDLAARPRARPGWLKVAGCVVAVVARGGRGCAAGQERCARVVADGAIARLGRESSMNLDSACGMSLPLVGSTMLARGVFGLTPLVIMAM
jgi:hypothetical protein